MLSLKHKRENEFIVFHSFLMIKREQWLVTFYRIAHIERDLLFIIKALFASPKDEVL